MKELFQKLLNAFSASEEKRLTYQNGPAAAPEAAETAEANEAETAAPDNPETPVEKTESAGDKAKEIAESNDIKNLLGNRANLSQIRNQLKAYGDKAENQLYLAAAIKTKAGMGLAPDAKWPNTTLSQFREEYFNKMAQERPEDFAKLTKDAGIVPTENQETVASTEERIIEIAEKHEELTDLYESKNGEATPEQRTELNQMADQMVELRRSLNSAKTGSKEEVAAVNQQASDMADKMTTTVASRIEQASEKTGTAVATAEKPDEPKPIATVTKASEAAAASTDVQDIINKLPKSADLSITVTPEAGADKYLLMNKLELQLKAKVADSLATDLGLARQTVLDKLPLSVNKKENPKEGTVTVSLNIDSGGVNDGLIQHFALANLGKREAVDTAVAKASPETVKPRLAKAAEPVASEQEAVAVAEETAEKVQPVVAVGQAEATEAASKGIDLTLVQQQIKKVMSELGDEIAYDMKGVAGIRNPAMAKLTAQNRARNLLVKAIANKVGKEYQPFVEMAMRGVNPPRIETRDNEQFAVINLNDEMKARLVKDFIAQASRPQPTGPAGPTAEERFATGPDMDDIM